MSQPDPDTMLHMTPRDAAKGDALDGYMDLAVTFDDLVATGTERLDPCDRHAAWITGAVVAQDWVRLGRLAGDPNRTGLNAEEIAELCLQTSIYTGTATLPPALDALRTAFADSGQVLTFAICPSDGSDAAAEDMRRLLHGSRHTDDHADPDNSFAASLYDIVARHGYGCIWTRPGLTLRLRLVCAVAALSITGPSPVFRKFARTAKEHGLSDEDLRDVVIQSVYVQGNPRTLYALMDLQETLRLV